MFEEEGPKDWEVRDEEPPEQLRKKWEQEEAKGPRRVVCPSCKKETSAENLTCIFCGTDLDYNNKGDQCRPNHHLGKEMKSLGCHDYPFIFIWRKIMKKCPFCAEEIQDEAVKCKHCNEFLVARPDAPKTPWYGKTAVLIVSFLTVGPFALPLVWFNPVYSRRKKIIVTVIVLTLTCVLVAAFFNAVRTIYGYYKEAGIF